MKNSEIVKLVSKNIKVERFRQDLTQERLAELSGLSTKYVNSIENAKVNPSIAVVVKICSVLNMELNQLMKK